TILLSLVLPATIYEYLTTAAGVLLIGNWIIILAAQIKIRKNYPVHGNLKGNIKSKGFKMLCAPYSSYLGILLIILALIGATINPNQRLGLIVSIIIVSIIAISYLIVNPIIKRNRMNA
ncbi:MAG: hypothetical protein MUO60_18005, partial [Clostridiaceae bacterium]|nr:hypothetical protein [Clostridiaceae bacterium]